MSKRFGRNQKRAMKAEIEVVKAELGKEMARADELKHEHARSIEAARLIVDVVHSINPNSIALREANLVSNSQWVVERHGHTCTPSPASVGVHARAIDFTRIPLYQLEAELRECDEFKDAVHFDVRLQHRGVANQRAAWRGSREALWHGGVERIAAELAKCLHRELQEGY